MGRHIWSYHEPIGDPCKRCALGRHLHRTRHPLGCDCGCAHKGKRSPAEKARGRAQRVYWVGIDGEGMGRNPHRYVLLAYSDANGRHVDSIADPDGLSTQACLDFLLSLPTDARIAGYYLGYDWTMILRDMPNKHIYRLLRPETRARGADEGSSFSPVRWRAYKLNYIGQCMRIAKGSRSVTIWDVGKFFQSRFVDAIKKWEVGTKAEQAEIEDMKGQRSAFAKKDFKRIEAYCLSECRLLAELIAKLDDAHREAGLPLKSWHGPGSTATVALTKMGIKHKRGITPDAMLDPISRGFFGGRFEQRLSGEVPGPIYGYDIVSAYPWQAFNLPCLEHGIWEHTKKEKRLRNARHALVRFKLNAVDNEYWGPLPIRLSNGCILFPSTGATGWCWQHEYREARRFGDIAFLEAWVLRSDCDCVPFALILEWFREREKLGKDAKGHTFRLGLNSVYGKLAQSVGRPQFRSLIWAGMITSGCRAQLLKLIHPNPANVLACATDGLYCKRKVDTGNPPLTTDRLGSWEEKKHGSTTFVRPGIYWSDDSDYEKDKEKAQNIKARGLGKKELEKHRELLRRALDDGARVAELGSIEVFGGAKQCCYQHNGRYLRSPRYGEWTPTPVKVSLDPAPKRTREWGLFELNNVDSYPYRVKVVSPDAKALKRSEEIRWAQR